MTVITKVTLTSPLMTMTMPISDAQPTDQFICRSIDGLSPPEIDVSLADGLYQGGVYRGSQPQDREIVMLVRLNPSFKLGDRTASGLRAYLYSMLAGQYSTLLTFYTDSNDEDDNRFLPSQLQTNGYVKRIEISPFAKDSEVQLTFRCPKPWLQGPTDVNEPLPIDNPLYYNATAPCGFLLKTALKTATSTLVLAVEGNGTTLELMGISYPLQVDDVLTIDTRPGTRSVKMVRPLVSPTPVDITGYIYIINNLWPSLRPGSNKFIVYETATTNPILVDLQQLLYRKQYWGV